MTQHAASSVAALDAALKIAQSGDEVLLAPGLYTNITMKYVKVNFDPPVVIRSADSTNPAMISVMRIGGAKPPTEGPVPADIYRMKGLLFTDVTLMSIPGYFSHEVKWADNVKFDNCRFHGSLDNDPSNDGSGLGFAWCTDVAVTNSHFEELLRGLSFGACDGVVVTGNRTKNMRSDGFNFSQVTNVKITDNRFGDFHPVDPDHPDCIQFWTSNTTKPSRDIYIARNHYRRALMDKGAQFIFLRDQIGTLPYENVVIEDNFGYDSGFNAIRLQGVKNLTMRRNEMITLVVPAGVKPVQSFILVQKGDGVLSEGNKAVNISFSIGGADLTDDSINVVQKGDIITQLMTVEQADAAEAAWLAKFGGGESSAEIEALKAEIETLKTQLQQEVTHNEELETLLQAKTNELNRLIAETDTQMQAFAAEVNRLKTAISSAIGVLTA